MIQRFFWGKQRGDEVNLQSLHTKSPVLRKAAPPPFLKAFMALPHVIFLY